MTYQNMTLDQLYQLLEKARVWEQSLGQDQTSTKLWIKGFNKMQEIEWEIKKAGGANA